MGFRDRTLSQHDQAVAFLKSAKCLLPANWTLFPLWDLLLVLDTLCQPPFEPIGSLDLKILTLKTVLLLALATAKQVSDLQALSTSPACMRFTNQGDGVTLTPNMVKSNKVI